MIALILRTFLIYAAVGITIRIMGKRQLGELQPGELITTILISEIVATPITDNSVPLLYSIIPLILIASFEIISSVIMRKSVKFRYLADGKPITVIKNGILQQQALKDLRFTMDDILSALRQKDVFDIKEVEEAIVETNGTLSVLLKKKERPLTLKLYEDKGKNKDDAYAHTLIVDGYIIRDALKECNVTQPEIYSILKKQQTEVKNVLLLTVDKSKNFNLIVKKVF